MFSAGEVSGDMHAAAAAAEIRKIRPDADMFGMGGSCMDRAGVRIIYNIKKLGVIGVVEVIRHLPMFFRLKEFLSKEMDREKPDVLVCVDYPGFNMRLARMAREKGIPVVYYIAPTVWAWNRGRAKDIARDTAHVASILPFEAKVYEESGARVTFVGHPLADTVHRSMPEERAMEFFGADPKARRVLLMPGSRLNEVNSLLPAMLEAGRILSQKINCQFFLPRAETIDLSLLEGMIEKAGIPVRITESHTYDLMGICHVAAASSGTATLETALMELPTVLLYRLAPLTWMAARLLVHVRYAGLPNLLLDREVTPELLQNAVTPEHIVSVLEPWLSDERKRQEAISQLPAVRKAVGGSGAVHRTAELIIDAAEGK